MSDEKKLRVQDAIRLYVELDNNLSVFEDAIKKAKKKRDEYREYIATEMGEQGLKSMKVEGVGAVTTYQSEHWRYPKDVERRKVFNQWVLKQSTPEFLTSIIDISSAKIRDIVREHKELRDIEGDIEVPGLDAPYTLTKLRVTKQKEVNNA